MDKTQEGYILSLRKAREIWFFPGLRAAEPVEAVSMDRGPGARKQALLRRKADRIAFLIVATDVPEVDIAIAVETLRRDCEAFFPGREALFEMIYGARFRRLMEQFRGRCELL